VSTRTVRERVDHIARQAEVIARASLMHAAKRTGDIDEMRATALYLHDIYRAGHPSRDHEGDQ
jgi:hypothetical protein